MKFDTLDKRVGVLECTNGADGWEDIKQSILTALDDFPDAKDAVVEGIRADPNHGDMEWPELRGVALDSLMPFPLARERVLAALRSVEHEAI